ncbi:MAG: hypothetical protein ACE15F_02775 [bacterium]
MIELIITWDYELPADGRGDIRRHILQPTTDLLNACSRHGARLTILAEAGEFMAMERQENRGYRESLGYDPVAMIKQQWIDAVRGGHDVQLHLHPQWVHARWKDGQWDLDYAHYQLMDFDQDRAVAVLMQARRSLEEAIAPQAPGYECIGFRAGHWNTHPAERYLAALQAAGLKSDTSVFKGGYAHSSMVTFDYRHADSHYRAWRTDGRDINRRSSGPGILEVPIAAVPATLWGMLTFKRIWSAMSYLQEDRLNQRLIQNRKNPPPNGKKKSRLRKLFQTVPKKLDFCKLTVREMRTITRRIVRDHAGEADEPVPLVMIGHSKQAGADKALGSYLDLVRREFAGVIRFCSYSDFIRKYEQFEVPSVPTKR